MIKVKVQKGWLLLTFLTVLSYTSLFAQPTDKDVPVLSAREQSKNQIRQLHDGVLIVRLTSKHRKIVRLEELASAEGIKDKTRRRLQKELTSTIEDRNSYNVQLTNAFTQFFDFTEVYFMYDTATVNLRNGERSGFFIDKNLESDPSIRLNTENYFILRLGSTNASTTTGVEALIVMDKELEDLRRPFPYYVKANSIGRLFVKIFSPKKVTRKDAEKVTKKLNTSLSKFYEKVGPG